MADKLKLYVASKLDHAPTWRRFASARADWLTITSRWVFHHTTADGGPAWPGDCAAHGAEFWRHDHEDVAAADAVLVYGVERSDVLRGALVEAGIGIALGKTVIACGDNPMFGTWKYHPAVRRVADLSAAESLLRLIAIGLRT